MKFLQVCNMRNACDTADVKSVDQILRNRLILAESGFPDIFFLWNSCDWAEMFPRPALPSPSILEIVQIRLPFFFELFLPCEMLHWIWCNFSEFSYKCTMHSLVRLCSSIL